MQKEEVKYEEKTYREENYEAKRLIRRHRRDRISFIKNATEPDPKTDIKKTFQHFGHARIPL